MKLFLTYIAVTFVVLGRHLVVGQDSLLYDVDIASREFIDDDDIWARNFIDSDIGVRDFVDDDEFVARDSSEEEITTRDIDDLVEFSRRTPEEVQLSARKDSVIIPNQQTVAQLWLSGHYKLGQPYCTPLAIYVYEERDGVKANHMVEDCKKAGLFRREQWQCVYRNPPAGDPVCQMALKPKKNK